MAFPSGGVWDDLWEEQMRADLERRAEAAREPNRYPAPDGPPIEWKPILGVLAVWLGIAVGTLAILLLSRGIYLALDALKPDLEGKIVLAIVLTPFGILFPVFLVTLAVYWAVSIRRWLRRHSLKS